jgi:hypothetical protein
VKMLVSFLTFWVKLDLLTPYVEGGKRGYFCRFLRIHENVLKMSLFEGSKTCFCKIYARSRIFYTFWGENRVLLLMPVLLVTRGFSGVFRVTPEIEGAF